MLIHIGYHKTATTWLQNIYFSNHLQIAFVGKHPDLWQWLISPHSLDFKEELVKAYFYPKIDESIKNGKFPIFSSERLSGNPHSGAYDNKNIADRLFSVFPQAKILIVIREQRSAILSNYKQYIKMGGICTLQEYLFPPIDGKIPLFRLDNFKYHKLIEYYVKLYGLDKVKVMIYEQFKSNPIEFINELANFIEINNSFTFPTKQKLNTSLSDFAVLLKRRINRFHGGNSFFPVIPMFPRLNVKLFSIVQKIDTIQRLSTFNAHFDDEIAGYIGDLYVDSNRSIVNLLKIDLKSYGYML